MEQLEKLRRWLQRFPLWGNAKLYIDSLPVGLGNMGLYPMGVELLERREDLLGNVRTRLRQRFILYRNVSPGEDQGLWLLQLQQWVADQWVQGLAPRFGDDPDGESVRAEKGALKEVTAAGTAVYTVSITVEYVKMY